MLPGNAMPAWPFTVIKARPKLWWLRKAIVMPSVGVLSKLFLDYMSKTVVHNRETLMNAVSRRQRGQGLITVCNHHSCVDDPVLSGILEWSQLLNPDIMRWSPAAHDICFTKPLHSWFFSSGKCVPIVRGDGVFQGAMTFLLNRLQIGDWVHMFPEGRVVARHEHIRLKWGVGRLVYESARCPTVLPFYHVGMDRVLPNGRPYVPRPGQRVTVVVGRPLDFAPQVAALRRGRATGRQARQAVTQRIQDELDRLRRQAERLHGARDDT